MKNTTYTITKGTRYNSAFVHNHGNIIYTMENGTKYCTDGFVAIFEPKTPEKLATRSLRAGDTETMPIEKVIPDYNDREWQRVENGETWTASLYGTDHKFCIASKDLRALELAGVLSDITDIYRHKTEHKALIACNKMGKMVAVIMPFKLD